jgi:hypothetical protein
MAQCRDNFVLRTTGGYLSQQFRIYSLTQKFSIARRHPKSTMPDETSTVKHLGVPENDAFDPCCDIMSRHAFAPTTSWHL